MIGVIKGDTRSLDYSSNVGPLVRALHKIWGFPSIGGNLLGVPTRRIIVFWGLHWVPLIWETTI